MYVRRCFHWTSNGNIYVLLNYYINNIESFAWISVIVLLLVVCS